MSSNPTQTLRLPLLLIVTALAGCSYAPEETATGISVGAAGGSVEVQEVRLKDGTRCAVIIGYEKGAISCDWSHTT